MANPHKGEVSFEANGRAYVYKLDFNALRALEKLSGVKPYVKFLQNIEKDGMGANDLSALFCCGLSDDYRFTEKDVGNIIEELGQQKVIEIIGEAIMNSKLAEDAKATANPTKVTALKVGNG